MKRVVTAIVLIPFVFVLVFLPPHWQALFVVATAVVAALAGWEYLGLARALGADPPRIALVVAIFALFGASYQWPDQTAPTLGILALLLLIWCTFLSPIQRVLPDASNAVFGLLYTGFTLVSLPALRQQSNGPSLVVFLLCVVWAGDIAALYVGRAWGRHKLAPSISPNKSWEGSVASVLGSMAVAGGLLALADALATHFNTAVLSFAEDPIWYWLALAAFLNVVAQVGDLAESALKRSAGVKDSGTILPGHGGVLDRIDALLLAAPALWYVHLIHHSF
ncbi:MAG TPA: phosphatidate cytidylyltransferase [Terracidiphilus sp.]